jgi:DNA-binding transcriptional ArsR family regulator
MPRAATTADIFNAVAERRRRDIVEMLAKEPQRPLSVNEIVERLGLPQPAVSKHLGVLRKVGLVKVCKDGQHRFYSLQPQELKPLHDWIRNFERFWDEQLDSIKRAAEKKNA